jgi:hypothetical protein
MHAETQCLLRYNCTASTQHACRDAMFTQNHTASTQHACRDAMFTQIQLYSINTTASTQHACRDANMFTQIQLYSINTTCMQRRNVYSDTASTQHACMQRRNVYSDTASTQHACRDAMFTQIQHQHNMHAETQCLGTFVSERIACLLSACCIIAALMSTAYEKCVAEHSLACRAPFVTS